MSLLFEQLFRLDTLSNLVLLSQHNYKLHFMQQRQRFKLITNSSRISIRPLGASRNVGLG